MQKIATEGWLRYLMIVSRHFALSMESSVLLPFESYS